MSHSMILKAAAVIDFIFGVPLLLAPSALPALYGASALQGTGIYNSMMLGATLLGLSVINWGAAALTPSGARFIVLGNLVGFGLSLGAALYRQFVNPAAPPAGWFNVALFLVFTVLFAWLWLHGRTAGSVTGGATAR